jgi:hypothetical protein
MIEELARLHHLRGNIFFPLGNVEGLREEHELSLGYARRMGSPKRRHALWGTCRCRLRSRSNAVRLRVLQPMRHPLADAWIW